MRHVPRLVHAVDRRPLLHPQQRVRAAFTVDMDGAQCHGFTRRVHDVAPQVNLLFYAFQSLVLTLTSGNEDDGLLDSVFFFLQISKFAVASPVQPPNSPDASSSLSRVAAFASVLSFVSDSCLSPSMNARDTQALMLIGPLLIICFGMCWSCLFQTRALRSMMMNRGVKIPRISYSGAFATIGLQVVVSIATVLYQLVQCTRIGRDVVLFVQGTEPCLTPLRSFLIFVIVVVTMLPFVVSVLLMKNSLTRAARASICSAFTPSAYLGNMALLVYRLVMSTVFVFSDAPSTRAIFLHLINSVALVSIVFYRPYINAGTQRFNVFAFLCLESQFALSILAEAPETFGINADSTSVEFNIINDLALVVTIIRYMPVAAAVLMLIGRIPAVSRRCSQISFGHTLQCLRERLAASQPGMKGNNNVKVSASATTPRELQPISVFPPSGEVELLPILVFPPTGEASQQHSGYLIVDRVNSDDA